MATVRGHAGGRILSAGGDSDTAPRSKSTPAAASARASPAGVVRVRRDCPCPWPRSLEWRRPLGRFIPPWRRRAPRLRGVLCGAPW